MTRPQQVVVVGAGMVGHRFVEELVRSDRSGAYDVHLVGEEEYEPYNRILLTEVVAGRSDLKALRLPMPDPDRVSFHRGVGVSRIDREAGQVGLTDSTRLDFDRLVLATGASAFVPPITGLAGAAVEDSPRHVHVLRSIDDCRDVAARSVNAKHAVVLGGGVLGLEAACGLRRRGVPVTVVHLEPHLMATQLDPAPATVLAAQLGDLGVDVRVSTSITEVVGAYGELVAVRLTDGSVLAADLLLLSCGVRANTALARDADLTVGNGIVVGGDLATGDPRIFAIGDCAQAPEGMTGLLAPGWRQAERLAAAFTGATARDPGEDGPEGVRLKAAGVDLVTMGLRASQAATTDRVVTLGDPGGRRHVDLVLRGDRLVGVTCLGAPEIAASVSVVFERRTPLPMDPLALLVPERRTEESSPVRMPGATTVCRCNAVSKRDIVRAWESGAESVDAIAVATRATTGCGGCRSVVCGLVDWLNTSDPATPVSSAEPVSRSTTHQHDKSVSFP